ncbi:MAG: phosphoribosylanthranilate isomerase [Bacteroidia bacterium]|nr:phosphoribosylanthranilate isomerase [Bacteroidia bacterium]
MEARKYPYVKICCISSVEEAWMAVQFGASALGLVGHMPSGPGILPDPLIAEIAQAAPPPVATFLLTSETRAEDIIAHHARVLTSTVQIVDAPEPGAYPRLRAALGPVRIVQVIHVRGEASLDEALEAAPYVDALLLDSGNPNLAVKELGGTGRVHDWQMSRRIREAADKPVFLAGGLHAGNVREAIDAVGPFGLDLCSGVRSHGRLDPHKLDAFFTAIERA